MIIDHNFHAMIIVIIYEILVFIDEIFIHTFFMTPNFRRQYRHPGAPALEIEVYDKGEEIIEWQKKADKKQAANQRVATNQRKPLNLSVGLKVLVEDKQGNNTLPGEIVGVRSQRSCWVGMADSDRIFLRNRRSGE